MTRHHHPDGGDDEWVVTASNSQPSASAAAICTSGGGARSPVIRVISGEMKRLIPAVKRFLADRRKRNQHADSLVSLVVDFKSGDPLIVPSSRKELTHEAARSYAEQVDETHIFYDCGPPQCHLLTLHDALALPDLPERDDSTRRRFFLEPPSELLSQVGYDERAQRYLWNYLRDHQSAAVVLREPT